MPRLNRIVAEGAPHHITQRGNGRQRLFFTDADHLLYLHLLQTYSAKYELKIWGYCLMPNHVHLITVPENRLSMARTLQCLNAAYSRYFNHLRSTSGHAWENRFYSCPMDNAHRWMALCYVERNPVRAGIVPVESDYRWSSAAAHLAGYDPLGLLDFEEWERSYTPSRWSDVLKEGVYDEAIQSRLRDASTTGRPFGFDHFRLKLEQKTGRSFAPARLGRRKAAAA